MNVIKSVFGGVEEDFFLNLSVPKIFYENKHDFLNIKRNLHELHLRNRTKKIKNHKNRGNMCRFKFVKKTTGQRRLFVHQRSNSYV